MKNCFLSVLFSATIITGVFAQWNSPALSSPADASNNWAGLTLDWNAVAGSQFYQLQVDTNSGFSSPVLLSVTKAYINSSSGNSDTQHFLDDIFFGKAYYWRVRAYIAGDTSVWTQRTFNTVDYVTLSSPATGSNQWTGLTLDWDAHPGVDFYELEVDTANTFNTPVFLSVSKTYINSSSGNSDTQHFLDNLFFGTTYYWRVKAINAVDTSGWSTVRTFNTVDYVTLSSPTTGSNQWTGLTLDWDAHPGVDFYEMEADTSSSFNSPSFITVSKTYINSSSGNSDTQHYLENLFFGTTYYWRVKAINGVDTSAWSTVRTFNTVDYVTLSSPTTGFNQWTGLTLDWDAHPGVDFYEMEADTSSSFNSPSFITVSKTYINSSSGNSDTQHYLENLFFGTTYYWRVKAINAVDTSAWSTVRTFNTVDYVTLVSPNDQQTNVSVTGVTLDWNAHPGIGLYQLEIDTVNLFNSTFLIPVNKSYINSSSGNSDTQYGTGALLANHIYFWRVRAINNVDTSAWTPRVFSTGSCVPPVQPGAISGTTSICSGSSNIYSITAVAGATSYTWNLPNGWSGTSTLTSINTTAGASGGNISVVANNSCGSSASQSIYVSVGGSTLATPGPVNGPVSVCSGSTNSYSIDPVSGATGYTWTLPNGWSGTSISTSISVTAGSAGGDLFVTANNSCGLSSAPSAALTTIVNPNPSLTSSQTNVTCFGLCNGSASPIASGGTSPYSYVWSNGGNGTNLCAGTNSVTATDSNGCTADSSIIITQPNALNASITGDTSVCTGNSTSICATASGGTSPYTYWWSTGNDLCLTPVPAGTYILTVSDANGCTVVDSAIVTQPPAISISTNSTNEFCGLCDGTASANASGGIPPYLFSWNNGGNTPVDSNLCGGIYYVTVTDANGCTSATQVTVNSNPGFNVFTNSINVTCSGFCDGVATTVITGNPTPITYVWSDGQTTMTVTGLCPGNYFVTVSDIGGCSKVDSAIISEPTQISLSLSSTSDSGNTNGTATVIASGGTSPFTYLWSNGSTTSQISNLTSQIYIVTVTDANGCNEIDSIQVPLYVGIESQISNLTSQISIFPNPNNGTFFIDLPSSYLNGSSEIEIYNMLGEIVFQSEIIAGKTRMNLNLFSGIYFYRIINHQQIFGKGELIID